MKENHLPSAAVTRFAPVFMILPKTKLAMSLIW
jgi:hypothetical protein